MTSTSNDRSGFLKNVAVLAAVAAAVAVTTLLAARATSPRAAWLRAVAWGVGLGGPLAVLGAAYLARAQRGILSRLSASEARQRAIVDDAVDAIVTIDRRGTIQSFNPAAERMFGHSAAEAVGRNVALLMPEPYRSDHDGFIQRYLATGEAKIIGKGRRVVGQRKDGAVFPIELAVSEVPLDGELLFTGIISDVTEQEQAEEALRESRRTLATLLSNLPGMAYRCRNDRDWTMEFVSDGCTGLTGCPAEDLIDNRRRSYAQLIHPDDAAGVWQTVQDAVAAKQPFQLSYRIRPVGGGERWVWEQGRGVFSPAGELLALEGFITDITEQREAQERIKRLNEELEERVRQRTEELALKNDELESFIYTVSHDLRAPLRHITAYAGILLKEHAPAAGTESRRHLDLIAESAAKMGELIDGLLIISRLERRPIDRSPVDCTTLVREVWADLRGDRPLVAADFTLQPLPPARADAVLLRRIWANLLDNALKYSAARQPPTIVVDAHEEEGDVWYRVRDNGVGFDTRYAAKLFELFQRLHGDSEFPGTGVGLAVVERAVRKHGGRVRAQSDEGKGATFEFTLGA